MNRASVIKKVSELSGVGESGCEKVLDALEHVLNDELGSSGGIKQAFGKIYRIMSLFKDK